MTLNKTMFMAISASAVCFAISYLASAAGGLNGEKFYPLSIARPYEKATGKNHSVQLHKTIQVGDISELQVKTIDTKIELSFNDSDQIQIDLAGEFSMHGGTADEALKIQQNGNLLSIKIDDDDEESFFKFNIDRTPGNLKISLPKSTKSVALQSVSGNIAISAASEADGLPTVSIKELELKTVSGDIAINRLKSEQLTCRTVSGDVRAYGDFSVIDATSVSGDVELSSLNQKPKINVKTTSGNVKSRFKTVPDIMLRFTSISGSMRVDSKFGGIDSEQERASVKLGTGVGELSVKTISGQLAVDAM